MKTAKQIHFIFFLMLALILSKQSRVSALENESSLVTIKISAAGDCTLGTDANFGYPSSLPAKYDEVKDPAYFLGGVYEVFSQDDLTIVNMEGTLTERGERADKTYAFRGKPEYTQILTSGSVEACNLANNHSSDYGAVSREDTVTYLEAAGITTFGNDTVGVVEIKGKRIGLVGIYELPYGINCKPALIEKMNEAKALNCDLIVASFHWGTERMYYPEDIQKDLAHTAIDCGADLVLGHHPHVLQGVEKYKGKYICYSLGNFCFGGNKNPSDKDSMIFVQEFTFLGDKLITSNTSKGLSRANSLGFDDGVQLIPCSISSVSNRNDYRPTILTGESGERVSNKLSELSAPYR